MVDNGITRTWIEWVMVDGTLTAELIVETNLETRSNAPGFDERAFSEMVGRAVQANSNGHFERVRVIPAGLR